MNDRIRWGILGTGKIARKFAEGLSALPDADLTAVGSRAADTAHAFADAFNVPNRHAGYDALADDPDVDIVYVATPHTFHRENSILCLNGGKAVLCEKPFTINRREAGEVIALAREKGLFLMEAMWTRFLPIIAKVRDWLSEGAIGDVQVVTADFGGRARFDPESRLFNPDLGGGALLDLGVYTVSFASMVFDRQPSRIASLAHIGETHIDEQSGMLFAYDQGQLALLYSTIRAGTPQSAQILGSEGAIRIHPSFWRATAATLTTGGSEQTLELPYVGNGYTCEAAEAMRCLREGRKESDTMPLDETLAVMGTLDRVREQWGLRYPME